MRVSNPMVLRQQVRFLQRQFLQDGELPFTDVLSAEMVTQALTFAGVVWKDRIYTPMVTLWVFLSQVLSADHSCREAVARLIAHRISRVRRMGQSGAAAHRSWCFKSIELMGLTAPSYILPSSVEVNRRG